MVKPFKISLIYDDAGYATGLKFNKVLRWYDGWSSYQWKITRLYPPVKFGKYGTNYRHCLPQTSFVLYSPKGLISLNSI
jgi:hypothetical protein